MKHSTLWSDYNPPFQVSIVQPFSIKHNTPTSVKLYTSTPSHPFAPFALVLNHFSVGIILAPIAHIHFTNAESLVHFLVVPVVHHAPTARLIIPHITLPTISFHTQIHNRVVFHFTQIHSIRSYQLSFVHIHLPNPFFTSFNNHRVLNPHEPI